MSPRKLACIIELTQEQVQSSSANRLCGRHYWRASAKALTRSCSTISRATTCGQPVYAMASRRWFPRAPAKSFRPERRRHRSAPQSGAVAGGGITYVAARPQALALAIRTLGTFAYAVLPSSALPSGMVLCIADTALAAAVGGVPRIDASRQAELQRETAPGQIATGGTMVTPVASVFQLNSIALRLVWEVSWMLRAPALAWVSGVNW